MHATKSFAVGEAGLIYSADRDRIAKLRAMSNFGFGEPRTATMAGLNGKLSEVSALLGQLRLADYDRVLAHRAALHDRYRDALPELQFQLKAPGTQAHQFVTALLPSGLGGRRAAIRAELADQGIGTGTYFSPHLMEQPYFQKVCVAGPLSVCDDVSARMMSLPLFDTMTHAEVDQVTECLHARDRCEQGRRRKPSRSEQSGVPGLWGDEPRDGGNRRRVGKFFVRAGFWLSMLLLMSGLLVFLGQWTHGAGSRLDPCQGKDGYDHRSFPMCCCLQNLRLG